MRAAWAQLLQRTARNQRQHLQARLLAAMLPNAVQSEQTGRRRRYLRLQRGGPQMQSVPKRVSARAVRLPRQGAQAKMGHVLLVLSVPAAHTPCLRCLSILQVQQQEQEQQQQQEQVACQQVVWALSACARVTHPSRHARTAAPQLLRVRPLTQRPLLRVHLLQRGNPRSHALDHTAAAAAACRQARQSLQRLLRSAARDRQAQLAQQAQQVMSRTLPHSSVPHRLRVHTSTPRTREIAQETGHPSKSRTRESAQEIGYTGKPCTREII